MGLLLAIVVHAADIQDRDGGKQVLTATGKRYPRLKKIWADGGYAGRFVVWANKRRRGLVEIVKRSDTAKGFEVLPHRWIVERTFAWLGRYRRMSKDYETLPPSSQSMIFLAMTNLMLHRLKPG